MEKKGIGYNDIQKENISEEDIKYMKEAIKQAH